MATVKADGSSGRMCSEWKSGIAKGGRPPGMPPNLLPIVSTGRWKTADGDGADSTATMEPERGG